VLRLSSPTAAGFIGGENLIDLSVTARNGKFNADQDVIDAAVIVFGR